MVEREVCLDTETTGISPSEGHRVIELACVEVLDLMPTGRVLHMRFDPERNIPREATAVHGLTWDMLRGEPRFADAASEFLAFLGADPIVAHNAPFDVRFLNAELERAGRPPLSNPVVDTLALAKRTLGANARATLDALCTRFGIDLSGREQHGALIDTRLLAQVYQHLRGGRNRSLDLDSHPATPPRGQGSRTGTAPHPSSQQFADRGIGRPSAAEGERHAAFLEEAMRRAGITPLWDRAA